MPITSRISTEESKKANSDVLRTPKIWHRNNKNHRLWNGLVKQYAMHSLKNLMLNQGFCVVQKQDEYTNFGFIRQFPALEETDPAQFT